jgi:cyclophilin family peptidyl-prolyl cis-trans isomerase
MHQRRALVLPVFAALFAVLVAGCNPLGGDSDPTPTRPRATVPPALQFRQPDAVLKPGKLYFVTFRTDAGDITFQLFPEHAPNVVNGFVFLAQKGFYDRNLFFRVEKGSYAQAGDPTGRGSGGPGYAIEDDRNNLANVRGTLAMGKAARDTKVGSIFFINTGDNPAFDTDRSDFRRLNPFGMVVKGAELLDQITDSMFIRQTIITEQGP